MVWPWDVRLSAFLFLEQILEAYWRISLYNIKQNVRFR